MEHLTDLETASFMDGVSTDKNKVIEHLNQCKYCFGLVCSTMELIQENEELCEELNTSFENWQKIQ